MTPRELDRARSCARKVRHPARRAAEREARKLAARYGRTRLGVYGCRHCGGFHLGNRPPLEALVRVRERRARAFA